MRAVMPNRGAPLTKHVRVFGVAPPAVLMTSADGASAPRPKTLRPFRDRVPAAARNAFGRGVAMITGGRFSEGGSGVQAGDSATRATRGDIQLETGLTVSTPGNEM